MPLNFSMLIVEGNQELRDRLSRHFLSLGYDVMALHHPRQALSVATFKHFNVALIDDSLPEMDGLALMQRLKRLILGLRVIVMPTRDSREFATEALARGAYDCVLKSCRLSEIARVVEEAVEVQALVETVRENSVALAEDTVISSSPIRDHELETIED